MLKGEKRLGVSAAEFVFCMGIYYYKVSYGSNMGFEDFLSYIIFLNKSLMTLFLITGFAKMIFRMSEHIII